MRRSRKQYNRKYRNKRKKNTFKRKKNRRSTRRVKRGGGTPNPQPRTKINILYSNDPQESAYVLGYNVKFLVDPFRPRAGGLAESQPKTKWVRRTTHVLYIPNTTEVITQLLKRKGMFEQRLFKSGNPPELDWELDTTPTSIPDKVNDMISRIKDRSNVTDDEISEIQLMIDDTE